MSISSGVGTRKDRRAAYAMERRGLRGDWGEWRKTPLPSGGPGRGWLRNVREAWANNLYAVLIRPLWDDHGRVVVHLAIRTASNLEPPWCDLQRIKNEICGYEATAIQVMPPESELVDGADMYHIWAVSPLPFSLGRPAEAQEGDDG